MHRYRAARVARLSSRVEMAIPNTTYCESLVMTNPVVREPAVDAQGLVHAPTAPGIGLEAHWGDTLPWEGGPLL